MDFSRVLDQLLVETPLEGHNVLLGKRMNDPCFGDQDLHLFNEGSHVRLYEKLGAKILGPGAGVRFSVWAPDAQAVSVIGDFNGWEGGKDSLTPLGRSGIWEGVVRTAGPASRYKFRIDSRYRGYRADKADPFAAYSEIPPKTASVVWDLSYAWNDGGWMSQRAKKNSLESPISVYEVHIGSWRRSPEDPEGLLGWGILAEQLAEYVLQNGFTHVELMPVMEHPYYASWGYQVTGYFAASSRYGPPQDLMRLIDVLHQNGIGVILDWVPSHFPTDEHGLAYFDGTHLYEHADARKGFHPDWKSYIFNYGRKEVQSVLLSSAHYWLDKFHADGLRVDAVASMLYLDYSRSDGEWIPNPHGGRENLEAVSLLRKLNETVYLNYPDVQVIAEESTEWPMVSRPVHLGGLGFGLKWDMGWMNDTLRYMRKNPIHRRFHHNEITFRMVYANKENFILPLSHDEVVHGKGSLIDKMPGDDWQKFSNLRALYGYMYACSGKKLLFMGGEFAQRSEWSHERSLDWHLLELPLHRGVQSLIRDLNALYRAVPALHQLDCASDGYEWIDANDSAMSVVSFLRWSKDKKEAVAAVVNFTPEPRRCYRLGLPWAGDWTEVLNSDALEYGGSGLGNQGTVKALLEPSHGKPASAEILLPPLSAIYLKGNSA